jgi:hypothetical protein
MTERRHADCSAHKLKMFSECPKRLKFYTDRRVRVARKTTEPMAKGKVMHSAIERLAWARRCKGGAALPPVPEEAELVRAVDVEAVLARLSADAHRDVREAALANRDMINFSGMCVDPELRAFVSLSDDVTAEVRYDFVAKVGDALVIRDWKCGDGEPMDHETAWHNEQVGLYLVGAHAMWPEAKAWEFHLVYVRRRATVRVVWSPALDAFWRARYVESTRLWKTGHAPAVVGSHCTGCDYRFECQSWLWALEGGGGREESYADMGDEALLLEREAARDATELGKLRRSELDKEIRNRAKIKLKAGSLTATLAVTERDVVAVEALLELAVVRDVDPVSILARACKVSSKKARALAQNDLERAIIKKWTTKKRSKHVRVTKARKA